MGITDTERLDFIQSMLEESVYTGLFIMRDSTTGRGIRLHETSDPSGVRDVRLAIDNYMRESNPDMCQCVDDSGQPLNECDECPR